MVQGIHHVCHSQVREMQHFSMTDTGEGGGESGRGHFRRIQIIALSSVALLLSNHTYSRVLMANGLTY